MGRALVENAAHHGAVVAGAVDIGDDPAAYIKACDVVIDFSFHSATPGICELAASRRKPVIIGTTGHNDEERERIMECARTIPIVWSGNYSVGVNLLMHLAQRAASVLGPDYNPEILELHHRHKKDAPSGTAENLADAVLEGLSWDRDTIVNGRSGITGERPTEQLGMHAIRGGEIIGEHTVFFIGASDRIELTHRASDRGIFVDGAFRAARWVLGKHAGLYHMRDVLGLRD